MYLAHDPEEWQQLKKELADKNNVSVRHVKWSEPQEYPFLVDAIFAGDRLHCCYVYLADAVRLCQAAGMQFKSQPNHLTAISMTRPVKGITGPVDPPEAAGQALAQVLSVVTDLLVETGIVKPQEWKRRCRQRQRQLSKDPPLGEHWEQWFQQREWQVERGAD